MLKEQIDQDLVEAMKAKNEEKISVLRMLKSAIKNQEIKLQKDLSDSDVGALIGSQIKLRQDAALMYHTGKRNELAQKEEAEINILQAYLPEQMSESAIYELVKKTIASLGASNMSDFGKVMGQVMPEVKGKADGEKVAKIVKEELSSR